MRDDSWRGGFLLAALEMYLKNDMRSKFHFLNDLEVALGFTSTMMTQTYSGTTTIVPQVCLRDFIQLFGDQTLEDMNRYFQGGSVAAYQHVQMMRLHYRYVSIDSMYTHCFSLHLTAIEQASARIRRVPGLARAGRNPETKRHAAST